MKFSTLSLYPYPESIRWGVAEVTCIEGCSCNTTLIDASSWASEAGSSGSSEQQHQRHSLLKTRAIGISPSQSSSECKLRVEVQKDTQSQSGSGEPVSGPQGGSSNSSGGGTEAMRVSSGHKFKVSSVLVRVQVAA